MPTVEELRDAAQRYYRLARTIGSPPDYAMRQSFGAQAENAADDWEAIGRHPPIKSGTLSAMIDTSAELEPDSGVERRRPGRQDVSANLIPVLRQEDYDQLSPSRGVVIWTLASAVAWAVVALLLVALW